MSVFEFLPDDFAPGDQRSLPLDLSPLTADCITRVDHPRFQAAYDRLWKEFGAADEMERREVIERRLGWHPLTRVGGLGFRYEMALVRRGQELVAVRDHIAILCLDVPQPRVVVHMSHVVVEPEWRRTGVGAWLRAVPIQTARAALKSAGLPENSPITLVAEMEHPDPANIARLIRLGAYDKAGFLKLDPQHIDYHQPDFRAPEVIDASGGPKPIPFSLLVRRLGLEQEKSMPAKEVKQLIACLYGMYATGFRSKDMESLWKSAEEMAPGGGSIALLSPTSTVGLEPEI